MKTKLIPLLLALCAISAQAQTITDTYWRNAQTGEWLIGFTENHVIYDCRTWDIVARLEKKDKHELTIADGGDTLNLSVSKQKKGVRKVRFGKDKPVVCEAITTKTLPDYPTRDERTAFKDNGYRSGDSVTIYGWVKDRTPEMLNEDFRRKSVNITIMNLIKGEYEQFNVPLDSLGRYKITIPVLNSSMTYIDWCNTTFFSVIEPGETYFFLYGVKTGQQLVMGKDARLQNELVSYPNELIRHNSIQRYFSNVHQRIIDYGSLTEEEMMSYLDYMKKYKKTQDSLIDLRQKEHPNLSARYTQYMRNTITARVGYKLMESLIFFKESKQLQAFMDYVTQECWSKMVTPYTLHMDLVMMIPMYLDYIEVSRGRIYATEKVLNLERKGFISLTDKERKYLQEYNSKADEFDNKLQGLSGEEQKALIDEFNKSEMVTSVVELINRIQKEQTAVSIIDDAQETMKMVKCDSILHDIYIARELCHCIDGTCKPLTDNAIQWVNENIKMDFARQMVMTLHEKYDALSRKEFSNTTSPLSTDKLEGLTEGEQILRELIAPWKGKIILIDVWGTWCGPCRMAMKHSQELYERMKPYNMYFLYLANRSDETSWKNVIKEYNVNGENVGHVNLPAEQQDAVERFLKVNSYPSYFLIDREGHLLNINADPRNLDAFEQLVKGMEE